MFVSRSAILLSVLLAGAAAPAAVADVDLQLGSGKTGSGVMGVMRMMGLRDDDCPLHEDMMRGATDAAKFAALADERLKSLKSELAITASQETEWNAYAEAIRSQMNSLLEEHEGMAATMHTGSATIRLTARASAMEQMLGSLKKLQPVTEALYNVLSADQRKIADKLLGAGCGMM